MLRFVLNTTFPRKTFELELRLDLRKEAYKKFRGTFL